MRLMSWLLVLIRRGHYSVCGTRSSVLSSGRQPHPALRFTLSAHPVHSLIQSPELAMPGIFGGVQSESGAKPSITESSALPSAQAQDGRQHATYTRDESYYCDAVVILVSDDYMRGSKRALIVRR
jgi:hypothetical protein